MTDPLAWTVRGSRVLHRDRWLHVRADDCATPDGAVLNPYYVLHYPDWVNVVAITTAGQVVTIRQYRHGIAQTVLELPGGMVDPGEDLVETARRELAEETGYVAESLQAVCVMPANPATHTNRVHTYLATGVQPGPARLQEGENLTVQTHSAAALLHAMRSSTFGQSMQAGPLLLALDMAGLARIAV